MQLVEIEEHADGFTVVDTPDGLREDGANIQNIQLRPQASLVFVLRHRVGYNHLVQGRGLDTVDGVPAEDAVGQEGVDLGSTLFLQELGGACDGVARICDVVEQNADLVRNVSYEHHARVLPVGDASGATFLRRWVK